MPLIEAGHDQGSNHSEASPTDRPPRVVQGERFAPRSEQQDAQQSVAEHMPSLAHVEVPMLEAGMAKTEQIVKQGKENPAGVMRREPFRRFDRDDDHPQDRSDPRFQNLMTILAQSLEV